MSEAVTLNAYRRRMAAHMAGNGTQPPIAYMAFGDGGHNANNTAKAADVEATALFHEVFRKPLAGITQADLYSTLGKGTITPAELAGADFLEGVPVISEAALVDANGDLCGIKTFAPKYMDGEEGYAISLTIRF